MKKVKVMLASMAVVSVLGALFSFSAKEKYTAKIYTSTTNTSGCSQGELVNSTTTTDEIGTSYYYSTVKGGTCSLSKFYFKSNL